MNTVIVVPCYNEELRLDPDAFPRCLQASDCAEVGFLLVNDGSDDGTDRILRQLQIASRGRIEILGLPRNQGKAEAVRQGLLAAAAAAGTKFVGYWDADLATPLELVPDLRRPLSRNSRLQLVLGVRLPLLGRRIRRSPLRSLLGRCFASVASLGVGIRVSDTQCGAKMFRVSPALLASLRTPFLSRWIFDVELLARMRDQLSLQGLPIEETFYEMPLEEWTEVPGSKVRPSDFIRALVEMGRIAWVHRLKRHPRKQRLDELPEQPASIHVFPKLHDERPIEPPHAKSA